MSASSNEAPPPVVPPNLKSSFQAYLRTPSLRILVVVGAGLSAASGLSTFRGAGGLWKSHNAMQLATPEAFDADPVLVWRFYQMRRRTALAAEPNPGHYALARAAEKWGKERFWTLTQNVDGLSRRAGHPEDAIWYMHGQLHSLKCFWSEQEYDGCGWVEEVHKDDIPIPDEGEFAREDVPKCPKCKKGLVRPNVVWFGEVIDEAMLDKADEWIAQGGPMLCLVVGTSGKVYPAAGYARKIQKAGGKVAVVDIEDRGEDEKADWSFVGDAAEVLPEILQPIVNGEAA